MKRIKEVVVVIVVLLVVIYFQTIIKGSESPNYASNTHNYWSIYYYGYVQCQPSYNENGWHAQAGYIRYWRYDLSGNVVNDTGLLYTEYGYGQSDSRILTKSHTYTDSIIPNSLKTQFRYGFQWQEHSDNGRNWPRPFSSGDVDY